MTLNFSPCSLFPVNPSEVRVANAFAAAEKNTEVFGRTKRFTWEIGGSYDIGGDRGDRGGSCEALADDILDLLPSDPFDMDMDLSAAFTVIGDWLEDIETEADDLDFGNGEVEVFKGDYQLVAELNFLWNTAMMGIQSEWESASIDHKESGDARFASRLEAKDTGGHDRSCDHALVSFWDGEEFLSLPDAEVQESGFDSLGTRPNSRGSFLPASIIYGQGDDVNQEFILETDDLRDEMPREGGAPHEALFFALSYLGVQDLLSAERVCRSLRFAILNDALLWRSIHIGQPLSERLNDDALSQLTARSHGNLQCLSLVECPRITDDGLKCVLESNPRLTKLSVPGCTRLSVEGIVNNLKSFNAQGVPGIKQLRIGGLYGVTYKHFEELKLLLGATDESRQPKARKPLFYHRGHSSPSCDDDRAIDIEMCPRCHNLRLVYDCPMESCKGKQTFPQGCRACTFCIARCVQCGRCIDDSEYEETFCLDLLCLGCWQEAVRCEDIQDENGACSKHTIFHQETRYCFRLYC